jgi:RHS repeat-associated protein
MSRRSVVMLSAMLASLSLLAAASLPKGSDLVFESGFENRRPTADAGPDRVATVNQPTTLSGSGFDADGDPLSYAWRVLGQPAGSNISLANPNTQTPGFTPIVLGAYQFELVVSDGDLSSVPDTVLVTAVQEVLPPVANAGPPQTVPRGTPVQLDGTGSTDPQGRPLTYAWSLVLQPAGSNASLSDPTAASPGFTPVVAGLYRAQLVVNNGALQSPPATVEIAALSPAPAQAAPPLPQTETTSTAQASQFLYTGPDPIQTGVAPGAIETLRGAVVRGRVITRAGTALPGVTVRVLGRPELGQTVTQADGQFDMALNGAEQVVLEFTRDGLLPVQRRVSSDWQGQRGLDRLVMIPPDPEALQLPVGRNSSAVVVAGSRSEDRDGVRRGRLYVAPGNSARVELRNGRSMAAPDTVTLRITEYTVGDLGPNTMPAELPWTTSYTYAADIGFDELVSPEATRVVFGEPLAFYVDNFLDFPIGGVVPLGYYDRDRAQWVPSPNGRVLRVLAIANGRAVLDVTGSGKPATPGQLIELGITDAELERLATLFAAGESFWRSPIPFLQVRGGRVSTPWDCNWPYVPPPNARPPTGPPVVVGTQGPRGRDGSPTGSDAPGEGACKGGSVIQCQRQVLQKTLPVAGTPFALHYSTERTPGWRANFSARIPITGATVPADVARVELDLQVAGRTLSQTFTAAPGQTYNFVWDGRDAWNRPLNGAQDVRARVGYVYPAVFAQPGQFFQAFSTLSGVPITGSTARREITLWQEHRFQVGVPSTTGIFGIGGFSLTPHHFYDPVRGTLFRGDGQIQEIAAQASEFDLRTLGGTISAGFAGDGGPATAALMNNPRGIAAGPDGSVYFADAFNHRVRRISPAGAISTIAGTGVDGYSGDGGLATAARLNVPVDVAVDRDGALYIADSYNHRIRRVGRDGLITTVAGNGLQGFAGDGEPAGLARLAYPSGVAVGPFSELYIADTFNHRIRKVGADGVLTTTAGNGTPADAGDGGPAIQASLQFPLDLDVSGDGEQFIVDNVNHRIRKVDIGGLISTVAGNGQQGTPTGPNGDGGPANQATLNFPRGVTVLADGSLAIADGSSRRVRIVRTDGLIVPVIGGGTQTAEGSQARAFRLQFPSSIALLPDGRLVVSDTGSHRLFVAARLLPQFALGDIAIVSPLADELYRFAPSGRHLDTRDTFTGAIRYRFNYDAAGRLAGIVDGDGNTTSVERDAAGTPTALVSPDNQRTSLTLENGLLTEVQNPANERVRMEYADGGLISRYVDARDFASTYTYDILGRLASATDAADGNLALTSLIGGSDVDVVVRTALDRTTSYTITNLPTDEQARQTTFPDGTRTQVAVGRDGLHTTTQPDGTVIQDRSAPDPRFGLQAGYRASSQVATGDRTLVATTQRSATLVLPNDPLSLASHVEQVTINGRSMQRSYDGATRTWTMTSPAGRVTRTVVDTQGRPLRLEVQGIAAVDMVYDSRGRLVSTRTGSGADERATTYAYSAQGFLQSMTDPLGRSMSYLRDAVGRTLEATRPDNLKVAFSYDANGNLATLQPAGRPAHGFSYTPVNLTSGYQPPPVAGSGTTGTTYAYNRDRQLVEVIRPDGEDIDYTYDGAGRLATQVINRGSYTTSYSATSGKLVGLNAPGGFNLGYTHAGALLTQVQWSGPLAGQVNFTYDNDFRISSISVNGANALTMAYDADGLLTTAGALALSHDSANGLYAGSSIGTVVDVYTHNAFGEPASYTVTEAGDAVYSESYTRDKLGRITRKVETVGGTTRTLDFDYDVLGRLREVRIDDVVTATYAYDANGNRLSRAAGAQTTVYTYDDQDRLLTAGSATYAYTAAGELRTITDGASVTTLSHDELGNLLGVALPDGRTVSYGIDGQNRRVRKSINGAPVQGFLYQDQLRIVAELDGGNALVSRFVYGDKPNVPAYMIRGGQTFRYVTDQVGSVRMLVNTATGAIAQRIDYDEFGNVLNDTAPGFQPFGFAGGLWDRDTGLVRFGARDYDPVVGRWTRRDPIGFDGGDTNLYAYVNGNPVLFVDSSGTRIDWEKVYGHYDQHVSPQLGAVADYMIEVWGDWRNRIGAFLNKSGSRSIGGSVIDWMKQALNPDTALGTGAMYRGQRRTSATGWGGGVFDNPTQRGALQNFLDADAQDFLPPGSPSSGSCPLTSGGRSQPADRIPDNTGGI